MDASKYNCTTCQAEYEVVRVEAPPSATDHILTCLKCGAPLNPRQGKFILKYFLVQDGPRGPRRKAAGGLQGRAKRNWSAHHVQNEKTAPDGEMGPLSL